MKPTIEQILIMGAIDAMMIDEISGNKSDKLIGKKYEVKDNSFAAEIVNGERMDYHVGLVKVPVMIVSNPYLRTIKDSLFGEVKRRMIKVKSVRTGLIYEVMFREDWIVD